MLAVSYFMTTLDLTIVNVSLPTMGRSLHFSQTNPYRTNGRPISQRSRVRAGRSDDLGNTEG